MHIPISLAVRLGVSVAQIVRVNNGTRRLSLELTQRLNEIDPARFPILTLRPDLRGIIELILSQEEERKRLKSVDDFYESLANSYTG